MVNLEHFAALSALSELKLKAASGQMLMTNFDKGLELLVANLSGSLKSLVGTFKFKFCKSILQGFEIYLQYWLAFICTMFHT